ncbi:MAG: molybdate ABC transporter substrate-binding protein [Acidisphaera sp.]|nr:molybdate ABC transporter substrate-binding protein [Acidisphaera sp.]
MGDPMRVLLAFLLMWPLAARAAEPAPLTVFAAASLTDAMREISAAWQHTGQPPLRLSFSASSTLAREIEQGAPANLFASADEQWMDELDHRGLIASGTRRDLLANRLVLVVPAGGPSVTIAPGFDLAGLLGPGGRLAVADPAHVPAGIYGKQALTRLGLWAAAEPRLAPAEDVRAALTLVERGEAPAGIVYATDAAVAPGLKVAGSFPASSHDPITYPFAVVKAGDTPEARALLDFLGQPAAEAIFHARGFTTRSTGE